MQGPLYSPIEMGNNPANLLSTLNHNSAYQNLFTQAFGQSAITLANVYTAITAFESSLISLNSRYDLYAHGYHAALTEDEKAGPQRVSLFCRTLRRVPYPTTLHQSAVGGNRGRRCA
jgi:cytochrome c peroxidase